MGFIKGLIKLKLYLISFAAGYIMHSCVTADERYQVKREEEKPYLIDTTRDLSLRIYEKNFQIGSIEHRIQGLLQEPDLEKTLEALTNQQEEQKK